MARLSPTTQGGLRSIAMEQLAALRAAVYAAPDGDAPRLVLADYLIERGDPRAT